MNLQQHWLLAYSESQRRNIDALNFGFYFIFSVLFKLNKIKIQKSKLIWDTIIIYQKICWLKWKTASSYCTLCTTVCTYLGNKTWYNLINLSLDLKRKSIQIILYANLHSIFIFMHLLAFTYNTICACFMESKTILLLNCNANMQIDYSCSRRQNYYRVMCPYCPSAGCTLNQSGDTDWPRYNTAASTILRDIKHRDNLDECNNFHHAYLALTTWNGTLKLQFKSVFKMGLLLTHQHLSYTLQCRMQIPRILGLGKWCVSKLKEH